MTVNTLSAAAANAANDRTGEEVDGTVLLVPLGVGQFAETWLGAPRNGGPLVAVKLFSSRIAWSRDEAFALIAHLPDGEYLAGGTYQGAPYLVSTYRPAVAVGDLARAATRASRTVPATVAARITVDAVEALAAAPKLHLAVHARHLLVEDDGRTVVVEAGSATRLGEIPRVRRAYLAATPLPPEVAEGTADLTSDFYLLAKAILALPLGLDAALLVSALRGVAADERRLRPRDADALRAHLSDVPCGTHEEVLAWRDSIGRKLVLRRNQSLATAAARANVAVVPPATPMHVTPSPDPSAVATLSAPPPARSGTQRATGRTPRIDPLGFALDDLPVERDLAPVSIGAPRSTPSKSPGDTAEWLYGAPELAALREEAPPAEPAPLVLDDAPASVAPVRAAPASVRATDASMVDAPASVRATDASMVAPASVHAVPASVRDAPPPEAPAALAPQPLPATVLRATKDARQALQPHANALGSFLQTLPGRYQELPGYQKAMVIAGAVLVLCLVWRIVH
jgi:hypothetical protein